MQAKQNNQSHKQPDKQSGRPTRDQVVFSEKNIEKHLKLNQEKREVTSDNPESHLMVKLKGPKDHDKIYGDSEQQLSAPKPAFLYVEVQLHGEAISPSNLRLAEDLQEPVIERRRVEERIEEKGEKKEAMGGNGAQRARGAGSADAYGTAAGGSFGEAKRCVQNFLQAACQRLEEWCLMIRGRH